jgi:hypothetical protein
MMERLRVSNLSIMGISLFFITNQMELETQKTVHRGFASGCDALKHLVTFNATIMVKLNFGCVHH